MRNCGLRQLLWMLFMIVGTGLLRGQTLAPAPWQPNLSPVSTYELDSFLLQQLLDQSLSRWDPANRSLGVALEVPLRSGEQQRYLIWQSPQMAAGLAARYPNLNTYFGQHPDDPRKTIYLIRTPDFTKIFYFDQSGLQYELEPLHPDLSLYGFRLPRSGEHAADLLRTCTTPPDAGALRPEADDMGSARRNETKLYRYRLALACTGEYGSYHGDTKEEVLAAMNELLLRVNAIYERELSIHFDLVDNNDLLIFLDPATDPYDNSDVENLLEKNKMVCNYAIGYPNYDLGHVLATKFGGQAQIGSICNVSRKAKAFSGLETPEGYYLSAIFAHELGHQLGAQHTQSNDCNRNFSTAYEPGSGSSLMAYAGICTPNVQELPHDYFHGNSLELISRKAAQGFIFGCVPGITTDNLPPVADAGPDLYVPIGTPFRLRGTGSDPNADSLSYLWEQMDALHPADTSLQNGPIFRTYPPTTTPDRWIGAQASIWEPLPHSPRTATFRLTVRDHRFGLGSTSFDEMTVHFIDSIGPFTLISPNDSTTRWEAQSRQIVQWDEAGTSQAPINCDLVEVWLSTDGGQQYDRLLAAGVPNTGSASVEVPELEAHQCRIMIRCSEGPVFDVSDQDFTIFPTASETDTTDAPPADTISVSVDTVVLDTIQTATPDTSTIDSVDVLPTDTTIYPIDSIAIDTTTLMPMDTTVLDTTVVTTADSLDHPPIDTTSAATGDTIPDITQDTLSQPAADTLPTNPTDMVTQDTVITTPQDTLGAPPPDTLVTSPTDTTNMVTQDTLALPPPDTLTASPTDTVDVIPQDTVITMSQDTLGDPPPDTTATQTPQEAPRLPGTGIECVSCLQILSMGPNPTSGWLYLHLRLKKPARGTFDLIDAQGRILQRRRELLPAGASELQWDLQAFPPGKYWLRGRTSELSWTKAVVISKY